MYGVPATLDLSFLSGAELSQVHLMAHQVNFVFDPNGRFVVWGDWQLLGPDGSEIDRHHPWPRSEPFQFHHLLGRQVINWSLAPPQSLSIHFEGGLELRLIDSSAQYESFTVEPGGVIV